MGYDPAHDWDNHDEPTGRTCARCHRPILTDEYNIEPEPGVFVHTVCRHEASARAILDTAAGLVAGDRQETYGDAAVDFTRTGKLWAAILGLPEVSAEQVALCMTAVKISRLCHTPNHADSWVDACGYMALGGDIAARPGRYL